MEHLGIKVKSMTEEEYCLIPMGGVLPKFPQRTLGIGGTGGMVHPSTGKLLMSSQFEVLQVSPYVSDRGFRQGVRQSHAPDIRTS
jgi:hypothetical protein